MKSWNYKPAKDIELKPVERARSLKPIRNLVHLRAPGLARSGQSLHLALSSARRGRQGTPPRALPFVLIANHTSHLDCLVIGSALPCRLCHRVFPVAAVCFLSKVRPDRSSRPR